jgi:large repetitive protein
MELLPDAPAPSAPITARPIVRRRPTVDFHATVRGNALWWSGVTAAMQSRRHIGKVDFLVDGTLRYTDHSWPYSFHRSIGWNSHTVSNGSHMLTTRAYGAHGYRAPQVDDDPRRQPAAARPDHRCRAAAVSGLLGIGAHAKEPLDRIALYVDGKPVSRDATAPYRLTWDTRSASEGTHTLVVYARGRRGKHRAALTVPVVVANAPTFPPALVHTWLAGPLLPSDFRHVDPVE